MKRLFALLTVLLLLCLLLLSSCGAEPYRLMYSAEREGLTVSVRGSFGRVKQLVVKKGEEILFSEPVETDRASADLYGTCGLKFTDLNQDGHDDILLATGVAKLETVGECVSFLCWLYSEESGSYLFCDELSGQCNIRVNESLGAVFTFAHLYSTERAYSDVPKTYTETDRTTKYLWQDGKFVPSRYASLTYYSETNIYCYSLADFNTEDGKFEDSSDRWLTPEEYRAQDWSFLYE